MDTSKDYYESVMRDFGLYGRGRSLEQYCRDEAVDYKWLDKAREKYGTPVKAKAVKPERKSRAKTPDMIQLYYHRHCSEKHPYKLTTHTAIMTAQEFIRKSRELLETYRKGHALCIEIQDGLNDDYRHRRITYEEWEAKTKENDARKAFLRQQLDLFMERYERMIRHE